MRNLLAILIFASGVSAADLPRYWSVHIDFVAQRSEYEKIDKQFSKAQRDFYGSRNLDPPPVMLFNTPDGAYYGLRPRGTLASFEKDDPLGDAVKELRATLAPISAATHKTLRAHHSEIWEADRKLTTIRNTRAPKYMLLRTDSVAPPDDEAYATSTKKLIEEVTAHGIDVLAFFSTYGDGTHRYLFMSDEPLEIRTVGKLARTRDVAAQPRPDLTLTDPGQWLKY